MDKNEQVFENDENVINDEFGKDDDNYHYNELSHNRHSHDISNLSSSQKVLSIIIVSYNSKNYLKNCIDSILKYPPKLGEDKYEIIIVDNNSKDGSVEFIEETYNKYKFIKLIKNNSNKGFSYANNIGIKNSNSKYYLLLNSDTEVFQNSINKLMDFFNESEKSKLKLGIAGPKIINSDGSIQLSCRRFPSILNAAFYTILAGIKPDNRFSRNYKLAGIDRAKPFKVDWVSGSAMMVSKAALDSAGLFDEKYFMYVEDVDLCYRMWEKDFKVFYYPFAEVLHHIGGSGENNSVLSQIRMQKSVLYFYIKTYKKNWKIILIPLVFPVLGFRILMTYFKSFIRKTKNN